MFLGFVELDDTLTGLILTANGSLTPTDAVAVPTFRVYGPNGLMTNGTGVSALQNSGNITGATNNSPIVITSASHGLQTGARVTISGVSGNTAANGSFTITRVDGNSFSLDGSTGNGSYTSGGTWHVSGLYGFSLDVDSGDGYEAGSLYWVLCSFTVGATAQAQLHSFQVS